MKIVIAGCGNVGLSLAKILSKEGHDITVIDPDEHAVHAGTDGFDLMGIVGSGSNISVLEQAEVSKADLFIATTDSDERNLLCCLMCNKLGVHKTIARVRNPEYKDEIELIKDDLGLSLAVNPELYAANGIARILRFPTAIEVDTFARGRAELMTFEVKEDCPLIGVQLKNLHRELNAEVLICVVERGDETMIPSGDFTILEGDKISFVASGKKAVQFFKALNMNQGRVKSCMIIGGGSTSYYLAKQLISTGVEVKIIEKEKKRCDELAEMIPEAITICGDGADRNLLEEEGLERMEAFVALTNRDEQNAMMAIYAKKRNPKVKLVTKVHRSAYEEIVSDLNIGSITNSKVATTETVLKFVRAMSDSLSGRMETLYRISSGKAEALEFVATSDTSVLLNRPLMDLKIKKNVIVACILHKGQVIIPRGQSVISEGDHVIIVTTETGFDELTDILV